MNDYYSRSPPTHKTSKDTYNTHQFTTKRTNDPPLLQLRHELASTALHADRHLTFTRKNLQQYEEEFDYNIINQLVKEICEYEPEGSKDTKMMRYGQADEGREDQRARNVESRNYKSKKKELSKYKAYAVKMKINSIHDFYKPKQKETRVGGASQFKNKSEMRFKNQSRANFAKMEEIFRANVRDIAIANVFQSAGVNIFKKRPNKATKNANIRKRSIKTSDKRREEDYEAKQSLNKFLKTSTSPKMTKKYMISLDQSTLQQKSIERTVNNQSKQIELQPKKGTGVLAKPLLRSPQKEQRQVMSQNKSSKAEYDSNSKFLQKMEQAIHFRKKEFKPSPPSKEGLKQLHAQSTQKQRSNEVDLQLAQASKTVIRTIYTSKDVIRNKSNIIKESISKQFDPNKRDHKVFVFNSEDQYIRKALVQSGWIHNHDHRSQFYHLKWVFKPDAIDYHNLKAGQYVNHVRNSHELTAKNYLNKNLKAYVSSWTSLGNCYPKCYDFSISSQKQQFYNQFKKEVMMILLRNVYSYFLSVKTLKVETLTCYYFSQLNQSGSYKVDKKGESQLRKKTFRKIDMEDYRQYDNTFLVHMNLLIIALRYWRSIRKNEELEEDDEGHFLSHKERQFEDNLHHLERYSKMNLLNCTESLQPYFEREYFATPSDIAIERVVKEYVYFQNQLGSHWNTFGRGNIWIVKPCSASRGNGIYLANDCSQILTDNRGIQSKIVQRYIERPLIFSSGIAKGRKFDLRQWVLLKSIEPLQIYMFSHCYVRICSEQFDITNINNLKAHLTNYSFNKKHYKQPAESVIDQDSFQQMLITEKNIDFVNEIRPKIKEIIIKSIKATQSLISDCGQRCFSLLGYDVLLDENCQPWLLEVNMSPACEERTEWLKCYLQAMGKQLLKIILPSNYLENNGKEGIPKENSASPSMSPMKKNWSPIDWGGEAFELKKVKTQMSQPNGEITQQRESYVNTIFELQPRKQCIEMPQNKINNEEQSEQDYEQEENNESEESNGWEKVEIDEQIDADKDQMKQQKPSELQIHINKQKFSNMELYLNDEVDRSICLSPNKMSPSINMGQSPHSKYTTSPKKIDTEVETQSPFLDQLKTTLQWERICFEQYSGIKKDSDFQMEVLGSKISLQRIADIQRLLEYTHTQNDLLVENVTKIQQSIRKYLGFLKVQKRQSEKNSFKLNLSKFSRVEEKSRQSKSALYTRQQKSFNGIEKASMRQGLISLKVQVSRPITARNNSNLSSSKLRNNQQQASFRQKIRSIALQAASRQSFREQQLEELQLNQPSNLGSSSSHASIKQNFINK